MNSEYRVLKQFSDVSSRTPHNECMANKECVYKLSPIVSCVDTYKKEFDTQLFAFCSENEYFKLSRRKKRYLRRQTHRYLKLVKLNKEIGPVENIFSFSNLYKAGKRCCNNVRWKGSVQSFEMHLLENTSVARHNILNGTYKYRKFHHFLLSERGKTREIDAPYIKDRQVEKVITDHILLPMYKPHMIYNNGASLKDKGLTFSYKCLKNDLRSHFRKYGLSGGILILDARKFFPSANHKVIYNHHNRYFLDTKVRKILDDVINSISTTFGMPLGVEPSQAEMIMYPSIIDKGITCQYHMKQFGHYMDDFYIIIPPNVNYKDILQKINYLAKKNCISFNASKTRYIPFTKPFKFCKAKFRLTNTGKIIVRANISSYSKARKKIKMFFKRYINKERTLQQIWESLNGIFAYLKKFNEHNKILKLRRLFYSLFRFSCERYENFVI